MVTSSAGTMMVHMLPMIMVPAHLAINAFGYLFMLSTTFLQAVVSRRLFTNGHLTQRKPTREEAQQEQQHPGAVARQADVANAHQTGVDADTTRQPPQPAL